MNLYEVIEEDSGNVIGVYKSRKVALKKQARYYAKENEVMLMERVILPAVMHYISRIFFNHFV